MANKISPELQDQAMKVAKATQKPGQNKEQTKLIAQGIEKGISEFKKQQNKKSRARDKDRKIQIKLKTKVQLDEGEQDVQSTVQKVEKLPWVLLALSWLSFSLYILLT